MRRLLRYDRDTGVFTWNEIPSKYHVGRIAVGDIAGSINKHSGYRIIKIAGIGYRAARLAWLIETGTDPAGQLIDHRNGNRADDRFSNLRLATKSQNNANSRLRRGKTLPKGVTFEKKSRRYVAQIGVNGRVVYLGCFKTAEAAHAAYVEASEKFNGAFHRAA